MCARLVVLVLAAGMLGAGCKKRESPAPAPAASAPPAVPSAPPQTADRVAAAVSLREEPLVAATLAWNGALASRNASALAPLYGAEVKLFAETLKKDAAIARKASALASTTDYTQSIGPIAVDWSAPAHPRAVFEKRWQAKGKANVTTGSLTFAEENYRWLIVAESDVETDRMLARPKPPEACESAVIGLVSATPQGSRLLSGPTNPEGGHVSNGLRIFAAEWPTYDVAIHESHPDHLATLAWFSVDVSKPTVRETLIGGELQALDPALAAAVKKACARP